MRAWKTNGSALKVTISDNRSPNAGCNLREIHNNAFYMFPRQQIPLPGSREEHARSESEYLDRVPEVILLDLFKIS